MNHDEWEEMMKERFRDRVLEIQDLKCMPYREREFVVCGLIMEQSITVINGSRGCGKSYLAMAIAAAATNGHDVGPWEAGKMMNTLIVDGELPLEELLERARSMNFITGNGMKSLYFYADAHMQDIDAPPISLVDKFQRMFISEFIKEKKVGLLVIDNLAALCPGIDENDKVPLDPISMWLKQLRYDGVTIVIVHHTGKSGSQRGTSSHEDLIDTALVLSRPKGYKMKEGCRFVVTPDKDRLYLFQNRDGVCLKLVTEPNLGWQKWLEIDEDISRAESFIRNNPKCTEMDAQKEGIPRTTFYRIKAKLGGGIR